MLLLESFRCDNKAKGIPQLRGATSIYFPTTVHTTTYLPYIEDSPHYRKFLHSHALLEYDQIDADILLSGDTCLHLNPNHVIGMTFRSADDKNRPPLRP